MMEWRVSIRVRLERIGAHFKEIIDKIEVP
jgi:hypothetical protein